jgi:DNA-directed RNA polymerase specialized sigma24 family protein
LPPLQREVLIPAEYDDLSLEENASTVLCWILGWWESRP